MPFNDYFIEIISCSMTVTSLDGTQIATATQSNPFEVADGFESGYDPVLFDTFSVQAGTHLSLLSNTTIKTNSTAMFQVSASFTAFIVFDDGSGHQGN